MGKGKDNWSEKYLGSDHHFDRKVWNKTFYESKNGPTFAEPSEYALLLGRAARSPTCSNCGDRQSDRHRQGRAALTHRRTHRQLLAPVVLPPLPEGACSMRDIYLNFVRVLLDSEPPPSLVMAWGRGGYGVTIKKRAQSVPVGDFYEPSRSGQTHYVSRAAVDDMESVSSASKKQDQKLLDGITTRLCKFEFDCVKPGREVASRTGFRRHLYGKKPLVERETRVQKRKDELMYPWDYTFENIYRPREKRPWARKKEKKEPPKRSKWDTVPEPVTEAVYPNQFPYRARVKRERKDPDAIVLTGKRFENMGTHELLAKMRGKLEAKPRGRSAGVDVDILLEGLHHPLPRSHVKGQAFASADDWEPSTDAPDVDPLLSKKITDSRKELADFERLLDEKFKRRKNCFVSRVPPKPKPQPKPLELEDLESEYGGPLEVNASFTQPAMVRRTRGRPVTREPAARLAPAPSVPARHHMSRAVRNIITHTDDEFEFPAFPKRSPSGAGRFAGRSTAAASERRRAASVPPLPTRAATGSKPYDPRNDFITHGSPLMKSAGLTPEERKLGDFKASLQYRFFMPDFSREDSPPPPPRKQAKCSNAYSYTTTKPYQYQSSVPKYSGRYSWRATSEPPIRPATRTYFVSSAKASRPSGLTPSTDLAVRQAKATLGRLEREWGYDDLDDAYTTPVTHVPAAGRYRTAVYSYGAEPVSPPPARVRAYRSSSVCYGSPVSYGSPATPRSSRLADLELKMAMATAEESSPYPDLQRLRTLHSGAKDKMDRYKVSLDRYLPLNMGPVNDVPVEVEYKYDELRNRMPSLDPYRAGGGSTGSTYVPPYKAASVSQDRGTKYPADGRPPPAWRPTVSDTRKRCRDVLAKSKGDPGYYDY